MQRRQLKRFLIHAKAARKAARREGLTVTEARLEWLSDKRTVRNWLKDPKAEKVLASDIEGCRKLAREERLDGHEVPEETVGSKIASTASLFSPRWMKWVKVEEFSRLGLEANLDSMKAELAN